MKTWYDVHTRDEWEGAPQAFQKKWFKMVPGWWNWGWLSTLLHIPVGSQLRTLERCVNVWGFVLLGCWVACFFKVAMFGKRMDHNIMIPNIGIYWIDCESEYLSDASILIARWREPLHGAGQCFTLRWGTLGLNFQMLPSQSVQHVDASISFGIN